MVNTPRDYWPWRQERIVELGQDVRGYFEAYYSVLRTLVEEHDPGFQKVPIWLKGGRIVQTFFCADGLVIVHRPYDEDLDTFPEKENSYERHLRRGMLVKDAVAGMSPPRPGGEDVDLLDYLDLDYPEGGRFRPTHLRAPLQLIFDRHEGMELVERTTWTRLDAVGLKQTGIWRDEEAARRDAREVFSKYSPTFG